MKILIAAVALATATPAAAAQPAAEPHQGHGQHGEGTQPHQGQHQQGDHRQHQGQGQHRQGHHCPCCRPGPDGRAPDCCERMHRQSGQHGGEQDEGHGHH